MKRRSGGTNRKEYSKILGINEYATKDDIIKAYRKLARKYHPNKNHVIVATEKFEQINAAHEFLTSEEHKKDSIGKKSKENESFIKLFHEHRKIYPANISSYNYDPPFLIDIFMSRLDLKTRVSYITSPSYNVSKLKSDYLKDLCGWSFFYTPPPIYVVSLYLKDVNEPLIDSEKLEKYWFQTQTDVVVVVDMDIYERCLEDAKAAEIESPTHGESPTHVESSAHLEYNDVPPIKKSWLEKFMSYFRYSHDSEKKKESYFNQFYNSLPNITGYFTRARTTGGYRRLKMSRTVKRIDLGH